MNQNDVANIDQAKLESKPPRAYPTPEPTYTTPRPILARPQPHIDRQLYFGSVDSAVSPTAHERAHLNQPLRADERRTLHYASDDSAALYTSQPANFGGLTAWNGLPSPTGKQELMAAAHGPLAHPAGPYHTPQSSSPVSVTSPHHQHVRQMYSSNMQHSQPQMYYGTYTPHQQQQYGYAPTMQPPPLVTHPPQYQMSPYPQSHHMQQQPSHQHAPPPNFESSQPQRLMQMPSQGPHQQLSNVQMASAGGHNVSRTSQAGHQPDVETPHSTSAPGPIRATTPLVVKQDVNGVTTISFEYSKDRVKQPYEIRCDVESVDVKSLSQEHKNENCVYPRACSGDPYKGNRWQYENECNEVAWALAYLNPELKGKRGLIQRAVDSWRNSNSNRKLRSRRVRRLAKTEKRASQAQQQQNTSRSYSIPGVTSSSMPPPPLVVSSGLPHSATSAAVPIGSVSQYHAHPGHIESAPTRGDVVSSGTS